MSIWSLSLHILWWCGPLKPYVRTIVSLTVAHLQAKLISCIVSQIVANDDIRECFWWQKIPLNCWISVLRCWISSWRCWIPGVCVMWWLWDQLIVSREPVRIQVHLNSVVAYHVELNLSTAMKLQPLRDSSWLPGSLISAQFVQSPEILNHWSILELNCISLLAFLNCRMNNIVMSNTASSLIVLYSDMDSLASGVMFCTDVRISTSLYLPAFCLWCSVNMQKSCSSLVEKCCILLWAEVKPL